jgi:hypothetical protein
MIIRIREGSNQAQRMVMARQLHFPARIGLTCVTQDQMGVDVGGRPTPYPSPPYRSISYGDEIAI